MNTEDLALFHRIVETGSLVEAADLLRLPKSTVSRRLKNLEDDLNLKLFHRQSRSMTLTSDGSHFYNRTLKIVADIDDTLAQLTDPNSEITGHLRIQMFPLPDIIPLTHSTFKFMELNPKLSVELIAASEPLDMIRHNIDVAFRVEDLMEEPDLVARPILYSQCRYYASPEFIETEGVPTSPENLGQHNMIMFRFPNGKVFSELPLDNHGNEVSVSGNFCTNSILLAREAAACGKGISFLPVDICNEHVDKGLLVPLFEDHEAYIGECLLVYPAKRYVSLACRRFIDFMMQELTDNNQPRVTPLTQERSIYNKVLPQSFTGTRF
ncbi:LysR family transcriptional regulator [Shewanella gelidii]|uniref:LysR family transcriptional regulator n=1 Tax=Shewanella gelidii TaxID=1642821 RepID=A0A917JMZ9_9GAMM|nr:LysR family transcriptional regulator [Shewanella gelidii]MCL1099471.1 LysR family transcriptional regulator [Shewanella gelidii]GGI77248.1 LysR family transcriptional regulator [Shewanella gelidii]